MDKSLDDIIASRSRQRRAPRGQREGQRDRRPNGGPRDGIKKVQLPLERKFKSIIQEFEMNQEIWTMNGSMIVLKKEMVGECLFLSGKFSFEYHQSEGAISRIVTYSFTKPGKSNGSFPPVSHSNRPERVDRYVPSADTRDTTGRKVKVENLHYTLNEEELNDLFSSIGPVEHAEILYDRQDRSKGIAFVTFSDARDARDAVKEFDRALAKGQPIHLTLMPGLQAKRNPFDYVEKPSRSLFDRIEKRDRSASPVDDIRHSDVSKPPPDHIDRYVPGQGGRRSAIRRRGGRDEGRRPGQRKEHGRLNKDNPVGRGPARRTKEDLDSELEAYMGKQDEPSAAATNGQANGVTNDGGATGDEDVDMIL